MTAITTTPSYSSFASNRIDNSVSIPIDTISEGSIKGGEYLFPFFTQTGSVGVVEATVRALRQEITVFLERSSRVKIDLVNPDYYEVFDFPMGQPSQITIKVINRGRRVPPASFSSDDLRESVLD
ncbi:MAG: hypothetical protein IPM39_15060 [Chloroflexi bacterium]|nr:hypothetical protein [Chloroflexota bacterium]